MAYANEQEWNAARTKAQAAWDKAVAAAQRERDPKRRAALQKQADSLKSQLSTIRAAKGKYGGSTTQGPTSGTTQGTTSGPDAIDPYTNKERQTGLGKELTGELGKGTQDVLLAGQNLSGQGIGIAGDRLGGVKQDFTAGGGYSDKALDTATKNLSGYQQFKMGTDVVGDRARMEDEVFGRLTRTTDRDYQREKEQLEQTLNNRGIPLNPSDPQYKAHMDALNERYDTIKANARAQATELGGNEYTRSYDIARGTHQQGMSDTTDLAGQGYGMALNTRKQNVGELGDISSLGTGTKAADYDLAYKTLEEQTRAQKAKEEAERRRRAGAAAGGTTDSAFDTGTPPGMG